MPEYGFYGFPVGARAAIASSLLTGLVAYWQLEEASGNRIDAVSGLVLAPNGSPTNATGKIVNGVNLVAASTQYLRVASNPIVARNTNRSFSLWIKPTSTALSGRRGVLSNGASSADGSVNWQIEINGVTNTKLNLYQSGNGQSAAGPTALAAGTWYHLVNLVTTNSSVLYLNGVLEAQEPTANTENNNATDFWVGTGFNGQFDGVIDEVGIWNRLLTATEIATLYNGGSGTTYPLFG